MGNNDFIVYNIYTEVKKKLTLLNRMLSGKRNSDNIDIEVEIQYAKLNGQKLAYEEMRDYIHKLINADWIPVTEGKPSVKGQYEVTFINECGNPETGTALWDRGDFRIPYGVTAWREHISEPYEREEDKTKL